MKEGALKSKARERDKSRPEVRKQKPVTVEDVSDEEEIRRGPPPPGVKKIYDHRAPKGVRFKEVEEKAPLKQLPDRPYVLVPPLKTAPLEGRLKQVPENKDNRSIPIVNKKGPAFQHKAPIEEVESVQRIMDELLNTSFTTCLRDLASISPAVRDTLKKLLTKRKVATESKTVSDLEYQLVALVDMLTNTQRGQVLEACNMVTRQEAAKESFSMQAVGDEFECGTMGEPAQTFMQIDDLPPPRFFPSREMSGDFAPDSLVLTDPVEQYLNSLEEGETPKPIMVARESVALRSLYPDINGSGKAESLLDGGSQICAMDSDIARNLGITYDPDIVINLQSANRSLAQTLGLAKNVPFNFGGIVVYIQLHIIKNPAYDVLLGRPFDVATASEIINSTTGAQSVTITDPNSSRRIVMNTYPRGRPPPNIKQELLNQKEANFRASRI